MYWNIPPAVKIPHYESCRDAPYIKQQTEKKKKFGLLFPILYFKIVGMCFIQQKILWISSLQHCVPQEIKQSRCHYNVSLPFIHLPDSSKFFVYLSDLLCLKLNIPPDNLLDEHHSKFRSASQVLLLKLDECDLNLQKRKSYYDIPITLCNCQDTLHGQLPTCGDLIFATLPT